MTELLCNQAYQTVMMFICGMSTMLMKEVFNRAIVTFKLKGILKLLEQMAFYILASYMFSKFLYVCAQGRLHFYCLLFYAGGLWLWKKCFYDIISPGEDNGQEKKRQT